MTSLSIHACRLRTKATDSDLSCGCRNQVTCSGMGRSMMSARARSESSEPNLRMTSTWPHTPSSSRKQSSKRPSGLKSMVAGAM